MSETLILNGHLIDPASRVDAPYDLLLRDGRVSAVERPGGLRGAEAAETIDASGLIVAPGLIDVRVHLQRAGTDLQREHCHRDRSGRRRRFHLRGRNAEHGAGERYGGEAGVDAGPGERAGGEVVRHARRNDRQHGREAYGL